MDASLENRTPSVWTWINGFRMELTEPTYKPGQHLNPPVAGLLRRVALWETMFLRWSAQPMELYDREQLTGPQDYFADHRRRVLTWQLPRVAWNALNTQIASKAQDAEAIQARATTLLSRLSMVD